MRWDKAGLVPSWVCMSENRRTYAASNWAGTGTGCLVLTSAHRLVSCSNQTLQFWDKKSHCLSGEQNVGKVERREE